MATPPPSPEVVVVGSGVIGCATAYFLSAVHRLRCTVMAPDGVARHASGNAAGELSPLARGPQLPSTLSRFCMEGLSMHRSLEGELREASGIDYRLSDMSVLRPAFTADEAHDLQHQLPWLATLGVSPEWLDASELASLGSWLSDEAVGAVLSREAQLETRDFALALAEACQRSGTQFHPGAVTGLVWKNGRAAGVQLGSERVPAGAVVLAAGPWTGAMGAWLDREIPIRPLKGQIVHLEPPDTLPEQAIFHTTAYVLPKPAGGLMVGTTEEDAGFDVEPTPAAREAVLAAARRLAPRVRGIAVQTVTACLRPLSDDGLPLIGPVPGMEGLYLATGHGRKGIALALATGKHLADLIADGSSASSLEPFLPGRLAPSTP